MKRIYTGEIRNLYVKSIEVNGKAMEVVTDSMVVRKDAPFYPNFVGKLISFEFDTYLPTKDEAEAYVRETVQRNPNISLDRATCLYACYGEMSSQSVSNEEFKTYKKTYKK